jgi:hypothetical protein
MQRAAIEPLMAVSVNHPSLSRLRHSTNMAFDDGFTRINYFPRPGRAANGHGHPQLVGMTTVSVCPREDPCSETRHYVPEVRLKPLLIPHISWLDVNLQ